MRKIVIVIGVVIGVLGLLIVVNAQSQPTLKLNVGMATGTLNTTTCARSF